jgi:hypothetical protein
MSLPISAKNIKVKAVINEVISASISFHTPIY